MDVAGAALRIGAIPGFKKAAESRARESYWTALFRARRQGSLNGVLDAAEAFGALGDRVMVEQCVRIAERLATLTGDADASERVRALAADLAQRYVDAEPNGRSTALATAERSVAAALDRSAERGGIGVAGLPLGLAPSG